MQIQQSARSSISNFAPETSNGRFAKLRQMFALGILPWMLFTVIILFFFLPQSFAQVRLLFVALCLAFVALFIFVGCAFNSGVPLALGMLCFAAIGLAVPIGYMSLDNQIQEYFRITGGASYRDIDPAADAATMADASIVYFQDGAKVDTTTFASFMKGGALYCVAPVVGKEGKLATLATFWAGGKNCCNGDNFDCYAAKDTHAHTGIVLADSEGTYGKAVKMAASQKGLEVPEIPLVLAWEHDSASITSDLSKSVLLVAAVVCVVHFVASFAVGLCLIRTMPQKKVD